MKRKRVARIGKIVIGKPKEKPDKKFRVHVTEYADGKYVASRSFFVYDKTKRVRISTVVNVLKSALEKKWCRGLG
jgi:hypothetical protein